MNVSCVSVYTEPLTSGHPLASMETIAHSWTVVVGDRLFRPFSLLIPLEELADSIDCVFNNEEEQNVTISRFLGHSSFGKPSREILGKLRLEGLRRFSSCDDKYFFVIYIQVGDYQSFSSTQGICLKGNCREQCWAVKEFSKFEYPE